MARKLTVAELRGLINEALREDVSDEGHHKKNEVNEDAESDAAAEKAETAEEEAQIASEADNMSESLQLERWKKLAGLLKD